MKTQLSTPARRKASYTDQTAGNYGDEFSLCILIDRVGLNPGITSPSRKLYKAEGDGGYNVVARAL